MRKANWIRAGTRGGASVHCSSAEAHQATLDTAGRVTPVRLGGSGWFITHPGVALLWVPALGGAPAKAPGGFVFEEQMGVGVHNTRVSESTGDL